MRNAVWLISFMTVGLVGSMAGQASATPKASASAAAPAHLDAAKLGAPIYPGAVLDNDYGPNKYVSEPGHTDAHLITNDSFAKVYAFYKQHIPANWAKPRGTPQTGVTFEIGSFGDANYTGVTVMQGYPANPDTGQPASGTQIDIVRYVADK